MITPIQGRVLVELKGAYDHIQTTEEKFGTSKTRGILRAIASDITQEQRKQFGLKIDATVYFGKYEDTAPYTFDGKDFALIELKDLGGVEDARSN